MSNRLINARFALCLLVVALATLLAWFHLLPAQSLTMVYIWVTGIFVAGDAVSGWAPAVLATFTATTAAKSKT